MVMYNQIDWSKRDDMEKETPVVLYGAAYLGGVVYDYLHTKTNIVAFIDKEQMKF